MPSLSPSPFLPLCGLPHLGRVQLLSQPGGRDGNIRTGAGWALASVRRAETISPHPAPKFHIPTAGVAILLTEKLLLSAKVRPGKRSRHQSLSMSQPKHLHRAREGTPSWGWLLLCWVRRFLALHNLFLLHQPSPSNPPQLQLGGARQHCCSMLTAGKAPRDSRGTAHQVQGRGHESPHTFSL